MAVAPGCCCCLGNVCQHHAVAQEEDTAPLHPCSAEAVVFEVPLSQTGVLIPCCCLHCLSSPTQTTKKSQFWYVAVRLFFFPATIRFQDDPRVYLLDLRGVVRGGIPLLPQNQQFTVSSADPTACITSGLKHFVAGVQQPIPFIEMVSSIACC